MKISGYVICKNEEAVIRRCISSLKEVADEIIVVDSGSEDHTIDIAHELGASVFSIEWQKDFSYARNVALEKCSGSWIVALDADEFFEAGDAERIKYHIKSVQKEYDGLTCKLVNIDPAANQKISEMTHLLAFRRSPGLSYHSPIHEQLQKNGKELSLFHVDDVTVLHTGYAEEERKAKDKAGRNIEILLQTISDGSADPNIYYHLAWQYQSSDKSGDEFFRVTKQMMDLLDGADLPLTIEHRKYTLWAQALLKRGALQEEIMEVLDEAAERFPNHPEVHAARGDALFHAKQWDKATIAYEKALLAEDSYKDIRSNSFAQAIPKVLMRVADLYLLCGNQLKALDYYFKRLKIDKYCAEATLGLMAILRLQPPQEVVPLFDQFYNRKEQEDVGYLMGCFSYVYIPVVFNFYEKIWRMHFGKQDASMIAAMLCMGNYKPAVTASLDYLESHQDDNILAMACTGIVMGNMFIEYQSTISKINLRYYEVLEILRKIRNGELLESIHQSDEIIRIISFIAQWMPSEESNLYIQSIVRFGNVPLKNAAADELLRIHRYDLLENLYSSATREDYTNRAENYYYAGVYALTQGASDRAREYFDQAMNAGFIGREIIEYERIIQEEAFQ